MEKRYENSIVINKPLEEMWSFLENPRNHPQFLSGLIELDTDPPGRAWDVGTRIVGKRKLVLGRTVTETGVMVEKVPNSHFVWDGTLLGVTSRGGWHLEPADGGTKVSLAATVNDSGLARILSLLGVVDINKAQNEVLESLRRTVAAA